MSLENIPPTERGLVNAIIETPKGAQNKYIYEPNLKVYKLKKVLPMGMVLPFDFGFIPNTTGGDGDPLDVLVIMEEPAFTGCLVQCRLLGVLKAMQKERTGSPFRNDRYIAVANESRLYKNIQKINDLNRDLVHELKTFFIDYNAREGKKFTPIGWSDAAVAMKMIQAAVNE